MISGGGVIIQLLNRLLRNRLQRESRHTCIIVTINNPYANMDSLTDRTIIFI